MRAFLRQWQEFDLDVIAKNLFVIGELTGECFACHAVGVDFNSSACPECKAVFKYIGFRRRIDTRSVQRFIAKYPGAVFIEFDDFKKETGKRHARKLLDM